MMAINAFSFLSLLKKRIKERIKKIQKYKRTKILCPDMRRQKTRLCFKSTFSGKVTYQEKASMFPIFVNLSMENINEESKKWFRTVV
jgi:hypothetical protein